VKFMEIKPFKLIAVAIANKLHGSPLPLMCDGSVYGSAIGG
jgi:hypothetical protein